MFEMCFLVSNNCRSFLGKKPWLKHVKHFNFREYNKYDVTDEKEIISYLFFFGGIVFFKVIFLIHLIIFLKHIVKNILLHYIYLTLSKTMMFGYLYIKNNYPAIDTQ